MKTLFYIISLNSIAGTLISCQAKKDDPSMLNASSTTELATAASQKQFEELMSIIKWDEIERKKEVLEMPDEVFTMEDSEGRTPVNFAAAQTRRGVAIRGPDMLNLVVSRTPAIVFGQRDKEGLTPLHKALEHYRSDYFDAVMPKTPDIVFKEGYPPILSALKNGPLPTYVIESLIPKSPITVFAQCLYDVITQGYPFTNISSFKALIAAAPDSAFEQKFPFGDSNGNSLLHSLLLAESGKEHALPLFVEALLPRIPDSVLEQQNSNGNTPLHILVQINRFGSPKILDMLLPRTPSTVFKMKNKDGRTPVKLAAEKELKDKVLAEMEKRNIKTGWFD